MRCKCKKCGREYEYNQSVGYDREICSSFCDGYIAGQKAAEATVKELRKSMVEIRLDLLGIETDGRYREDKLIIADIVERIETALKDTASEG